MEKKARQRPRAAERKTEEAPKKQPGDEERLAALGIIAAGISHELNNALSTVLTVSHLILEQMQAGQPHRGAIESIVRQAERARTLVRCLAPIRPVKIDVNQLIRVVADVLIEQGVFKDSTVTMNLSDNLPQIAADPEQIKQVMQGLLINMIGEAGTPTTVEVSTKSEGSSVEIFFCGSGCHIAAEHGDMVFAPFFFSGETKKGAAAGMAVCYGIIRKHGGDIAIIKDAAGTGVTFLVRLPADG